MKKKALVIGAGVTGLTTALKLKEQGFDVLIIADKFAPNITSCVAGALWEWPPAVCGYHGAPRSLERSKLWCMDSYREFKILAGIKNSGVYLRDVLFFFKKPLEELPLHSSKMEELALKVDGFVRNKDLIREKGISNIGIADAYKHMAPMIDTDQYMHYLTSRVLEVGCQIKTEKVEGNIIREEADLLRKYNCSLIVNCTGLGSIDIGPNMYPLRGSLIRLKDPERTIKEAFCIAHDETQNMQDIVFIVPRGNNILVVGGTAEENQWNTKLDFRYKPIREMYKRNADFLPQLTSLEIDEEPVRTGLRPFTKDNVCLERTPGTKIIHNYGHGGAGVTLSWGCAQEVSNLATQVIDEELSTDDYLQYIVHPINPSKKCVFVLQDVMSHRANFANIKSSEINLIFLCSKNALSKLIPSQYNNFNLIKAIPSFDTGSVNAELRNISKAFSIILTDARVITNDDLCVGLASELRDMCGMAGDKPIISRQFADKQGTKDSLRDTHIVLPKNIVFDKKQYITDGDEYLQRIVATLGNKMFIKPVRGAGSEDTARIEGIHQLKAWCDKMIDSAKIFEIDEFIEGTLYNSSLVIQNGEFIYFAVLEHMSPNDEFLQGKPLGNITIKEDSPNYWIYKDYSISLLKSLKDGYPNDGVVNIDFFVRNDGQIVLMEVASRAPGGMISMMYEKVAHLHLEEVHLKLSMGETIDFIAPQKNLYAAYVIYPCIDDRVREITVPKLESSAQYLWNIYPGKILSMSCSMRDVAAGVMIWSEDNVGLQRDYYYLCKHPIYTGYTRTEEERLNAVKIIETAMIDFLSKKKLESKELKKQEDIQSLVQEVSSETSVPQDVSFTGDLLLES